MGQRDTKVKGFIYFAAISTSLTTFSTGVCFVWTSPIIPKFQSEDVELNPIGRPVTITESAWIVAAMTLGLMIGPILAVLALRFSTKKTVLLLAVGPILFGHITCIFANKANLFIFARILMGIGSGAVWSVLGTFIAEIAENKNRGFLGSFPGIASNIGSLSVYVIGPYTKIWQFSIVQIVPIILFCMTFGFLVPDSPYDLIVRGKSDLAEKSLKKLRQTDKVGKELLFVQETVQRGNECKIQFAELIKDRGFRKGLTISTTLMIFQQLTGILAVVSYAETIFRLAGDFIPPSISPMILGVVATTSQLISSKLIDKMGRKMLFSGACISEAISLFALGFYFFRLNHGLDVSAISWVPIASLAIFMFSFNSGLGNIPWIVTGEIFSSKVKPIASTITALSNFIVSFLIVICFPYMIEYFGMGPTFWFFGSCMVLGAIVCIWLLPETKGKSFLEIQDLLKN
ncbi:facilitated trehalose transporter Tret1 [Dendroctonus ponderosae]|uniref:facilitated trehalose transporter Tret1 n=1 Tax=Dendroctonus ponderosae TaxID=77166 RepID=UPI002034F851|nr:facilitated trehalose transporter Tret1 [Dendroctonus ponderosae]